MRRQFFPVYWRGTLRYMHSSGAVFGAWTDRGGSFKLIGFPARRRRHPKYWKQKAKRYAQ